MVKTDVWLFLRLSSEIHGKSVGVNNFDLQLSLRDQNILYLKIYYVYVTGAFPEYESFTAGTGQPSRGKRRVIKDNFQRIGFTCAYTPLPIIHAAGYVPFRVLPVGDAPDQAGHILHDNLCPHVKRILDRALAQDLPQLAAIVFLNSCDAMRRLADAWRRVRPHDRMIILDLPTTADKRSLRFFADELARLAHALEEWGGRLLTETDIATSIDIYSELSHLLAQLRNRMRQGQLPGGSARLQEIYNLAATKPLEASLDVVQKMAAERKPVSAVDHGTPVFLFGNVMPDPQAFSLFESCGARVVGDDFCTGTRQFSPIEFTEETSVFLRLAKSALGQQLCARTFDPQQPGTLAATIFEQAQASGARGVIGHTLKFCDPYLSRLPMVRQNLKDANLPLLLLEGDCNLRSIEQQRTRIEAFVEMLR
jgi:benzoyl-CoA reductase/2-hydroxyglutaryl-CoA dehydratase subunit BcrC/BadD/HgdB